MIGYDTIYALQDKADDAVLGVKSTALKFADRVKLALSLFYGAAWALMLLAGALLDATIAFYGAMGAVGVHLLWQVKALDIDSPPSALGMFQSNRDCGALIFAAFALDTITKTIG